MNDWNGASFSQPSKEWLDGYFGAIRPQLKMLPQIDGISHSGVADRIRPPNRIILNQLIELPRMNS